MPQHADQHGNNIDQKVIMPIDGCDTIHPVRAPNAVPTSRSREAITMAAVLDCMTTIALTQA